MKKIIVSLIFVLIGLIGPASAHAAAIVQSTSSPQLSGVSQRLFGVNTTAGNLLVSCVHAAKVGTTITMEDSQGGTWSLAATAVASGTAPTTIAVFYRPNITGGSITASSTESGASAQSALYLQEYSGMALTNPVDTFLMASATSTLVSSGIMTTQGQNELMYQCTGQAVAPTFTAINSFTREEKPVGGRAWISDLIAASTTPTGMGTLSASTNWETIMVAFLTAQAAVQPPFTSYCDLEVGTFISSLINIQ